MNGRPLTDGQIASALRKHLPEHSQTGLAGRILSEAAATSQQRALPSILGRLGDVDPIARRRTVLLAAALFAMLAISGSVFIGSRLLERDPLTDPNLAPPADLPAFVKSAYDRMPELPPLAMTTIEDGAVKGRVYVHGTGAVRLERYDSLDATEPESYRVLSGHTMSELTLAGSERVWVEQDEAISEDPRVFVYGAMSNVARWVQPGCEVSTGTGWRYIGLEYVLGRPAHHVACMGDLWIDVETRLILRNRAPAFDDALQPIPGAFRTIEVVELEFGDQPAGLFDHSRPDGVAQITPEQECARDPSCSATPVPDFTPRPDAKPGVYPPVSPNLASNGWVAYVMHSGISRDGPADIYLVREGVAPRLIAGGNYKQGQNGCPTFSPDGSRLAYAEALKHESDDSLPELTVVVLDVDEAGSRVGPVIRIPVPGPSHSGLPCPKWSPDGGRIAYGSTTEAGFAGLAVTNLATSTTVVLASDDSEGRVAGPWIANWGSFAWSPAGDALAVIEGGGGLWLLPTDGGEPRLLRGGTFSELAWSADGSRIVATTCPASCERDSVRVLRVDGTAADLELGHGEHPVWSPNGDRLAYVSFAQGLVITDADGANERVLPYVSDDAGEEPWGLASGVRWSPDGRQLLYIGFTRVPTHAYAPVTLSVAGDASPVVLAPPTMKLYSARETDLSWQAVP